MNINEERLEKLSRKLGVTSEKFIKAMAGLAPAFEKASQSMCEFIVAYAAAAAEKERVKNEMEEPRERR